jgi:hypothetical protein
MTLRLRNQNYEDKTENDDSNEIQTPIPQYRGYCTYCDVYTRC